MPIVDSFLPEFDHEFATARRLLERVPEADFGWKPHDKSMSLGQLAGHIGNLAYWLTETLKSPSFDLGSDNPATRNEPPASRSDLLGAFDDKVKTARAALAQTSDAEMMAPWTLKQGAHDIFSMPRVAVVRSFVMNHMVHHRGQLSVYLRLRNVAVPAIYGPSADEQ